MNIKIKNYSKTIKNIEILKNINLEFISGNIYGIVGKNGSGKSILLKSICGFVNILEGEIQICGKTIGKDIDFCNDIGAVLDGSGFLNNISGFENLSLLASINKKIGEEDIKKSMLMLGLDPNNKNKYKTYSMGMKQKLSICQAIMENHPILILDEIFNALDSDSVEDVRRLLKMYKDQGKLIIITSHNKEDIDILCDETYLIENGKIHNKL